MSDYGARVYGYVQSAGDTAAKQAALKSLSDSDYDAYEQHKKQQDNALLPKLGRSIERGILPDYLESKVPGKPSDNIFENLPETLIDTTKAVGEGMAGTAGGLAGASAGAPGGPLGVVGGMMGGAGVATGAAKLAGDALGTGYATARGYMSPKEGIENIPKMGTEALIAGAAGAVGEGIGGLVGKALFNQGVKQTGRKSVAILETGANKGYTNTAKNVDPDKIATEMAEGVRKQATKVKTQAKKNFDVENKSFDRSQYKPPQEKINFLKGKGSLENTTDLYNNINRIPDVKGKITPKQDILKVTGADEGTFQKISKMTPDEKGYKKAFAAHQKKALSNLTDRETEAVRRYLQVGVEDSRTDPNAVHVIENILKKVNEVDIKKTKFADPIKKYESAMSKTSTGGRDPTFDLITNNPSGPQFKIGENSEDLSNFLFKESGIKTDTAKKVGALLKEGGSPVKEGDIIKAMKSKPLQGKQYLQPSTYGQVQGKITKDQMRSARTFAEQYRKYNNLDEINFLSNPKGNVKTLKGSLSAKVEDAVSGKDIKNYNSETLHKYFTSPRFTKVLKNYGVSEATIDSFQKGSAKKAEAQSLYKAIEKIAGNPNVSTSVTKKVNLEGVIPPEDLINLAMFARMNGAKASNFLRAGVSSNSN